MDKILILIITAVVSGLVGSYITGYGHRRKSLWDLRFVAYQELIVSLHSINDYCKQYGHYASGIVEGEKLMPPNSTEFNTKFAALRVSMSQGQILYSKEVQNALNDLCNCLGDDSISDVEKLYHGHSDEAGKCLKTVGECAIIDLELKPSLRAITRKFFNFIKG